MQLQADRQRRRVEAARKRRVAGSPARFTEIVKTSERYIESGSAVFSPRRNAVVGAVGVAITSQRANACSEVARG